MNGKEIWDKVAEFENSGIERNQAIILACMQFAAKVTAEDREKHAVLSEGRFPVKNASQARSALRLRGHSKSKEERRKIINRAARFLPDEAKKAREQDKKDNLI